eukprot:TRINITY_DN31660_c0_g1_i1.p1 TRINITY_DN31660_c0_g1~~TRINITY_DN31660_c0_g1_i1.p1  ORF type:complete len:121 (-),score=3.65 TRINITY_DN31660_c0_g1_i1:191-553(-)
MVEPCDAPTSFATLQLMYEESAVGYGVGNPHHRRIFIFTSYSPIGVSSDFIKDMKRNGNAIIPKTLAILRTILHNMAPGWFLQVFDRKVMLKEFSSFTPFSTIIMLGLAYFLRMGLRCHL